MMTEKQIENLKDYIQALIYLNETIDARHYSYSSKVRAEERVEYIEDLLLKE